MFEIKKNIVTIAVDTYEGFEHQYVADLQKDLIQLMQSVHMLSKHRELDDFPTGDLYSIVQLQQALCPSVGDLEAAYPIIFPDGLRI